MANTDAANAAAHSHAAIACVLRGGGGSVRDIRCAGRRPGFLGAVCNQRPGWGPRLQIEGRWAQTVVPADRRAAYAAGMAAGKAASNTTALSSSLGWSRGPQDSGNGGGKQGARGRGGSDGFGPGQNFRSRKESAKLGSTTQKG